MAQWEVKEFQQHHTHPDSLLRGIPRWYSGKESTCQHRKHRFNPWVGKILWRRKWQPAPVFLPGESHRQRSLVGYSPWGHERVRHNLATKHNKKRHQRVCCLPLSPCHVSISKEDVRACQVTSVMSNSLQPYGP